MTRPVTTLAGVGFAVIFGGSFLVTKGALAALDPFEVLFLRFLLATAILAALGALRLVRFAFRGKPLARLGLVCLLQPLLYFPCEIYGLREAATSTAGIVAGALPAAVALAGLVLLGERLSARQTLALAASLAGVALVALSPVAAGGSPRGSDSPRGLLLLLAALAVSALFNVASRWTSRDFTPAETTLAMMAAGALVFGVVAVARGAAPGSLLGPQGLAVRAARAWPAIVYLGGLSSVLAFFLVNFTLARLKAAQSAVYVNLTTVVAVAAAVVIGGERLGAMQAAGAALVILGVWGTNAAPARGQRRSDAHTGLTSLCSRAASRSGPRGGGRVTCTAPEDRRASSGRSRGAPGCGAYASGGAATRTSDISTRAALSVASTAAGGWNFPVG